MKLEHIIAQQIILSIGLGIALIGLAYEFKEMYKDYKKDKNENKNYRRPRL